MQTEIEPKQQPINQTDEPRHSASDALVENNGLGLLFASGNPLEDEQLPYKQLKKHKKKRKKGFHL